MPGSLRCLGEQVLLTLAVAVAAAVVGFVVNVTEAPKDDAAP